MSLTGTVQLKENITEEGFANLSNLFEKCMQNVQSQEKFVLACELKFTGNT